MAHFDDFCVLGKGLLHATHVSWGQLQSTIIAPFFISIKNYDEVSFLK